MADLKQVYLTDLGLKPLDMVLGLINSSNNIALTPEQISIAGVSPLNGPEGLFALGLDGTRFPYQTNTSIGVMLLNSEVKNDVVNFNYRRIDLANFFSHVSPKLNKGDIELDENGQPKDLQAFFKAVKNKYGLLLNEKDFELKSSDLMAMSIVAHPTNPAYTGKFDIQLAPSLKQQFKALMLDGFELIKPIVQPDTYVHGKFIVPSLQLVGFKKVHSEFKYNVQLAENDANWLNFHLRSAKTPEERIKVLEGELKKYYPEVNWVNADGASGDYNLKSAEVVMSKVASDPLKVKLYLDKTLNPSTVDYICFEAN